MTKPTRALKALILIIAGLGVSFSARAASQTPLQADDDRILAKAVVLWLTQGQFRRVIDEFTPQARERFPQEKLETVWQSLEERLGPYEAIVSVRTETASDTGKPVVVFCQFEQSKISAKIVFDEHHRITGLWFSPADEADLANPENAEEAASIMASAAKPAAAVSAAELIREREVFIGKDPWVLPGTFTIPAGAGPFPAVVLVHGSGPQDRDESIGQNKPFLDFAAGLAKQGIAVLRYEKRTKAHAQQLVTLLKDRLTVKDEVIDDALAAVDWLQHAPEVQPKRIFMLGHSMGGWLLPRIAQATDALAGGIILAGNTRPLEVLIVDQMSTLMSLDGAVSETERIQLDQLKANLEKISDPALGTPGSQLGSPFGVPPSYWLDLRGYHPAEMAAKLALPLLILQGERDYQVTLVDFAGWKTALRNRPSVAFKVYPKLNHLFMEGEGKSTPQEYERPGHVSAEVIQDVAGWILSQGQPRAPVPNP